MEYDIRHIVEQHVPIMTESFEQTFANAYHKYYTLAKAGQGNHLAYIYISYMRSSIHSHSPLFRIDLYGPLKFSDPVKHCVPWDVPFVIDYLDTTFPLPHDRKSSGNHKKCAEINHMRLRMACDCFSAISSFIGCITSDMRKDCPGQMKWKYGEFLGEFVTI